MGTRFALRQARKHIDRGALLLNYRRLQKVCRGSRLMAVIKADAYGHGLRRVAGILQPVAHGFAVATVNEGLFLRRLGIEQTVLVMQGFLDGEEMAAALERKLSLLIHSPEQLALLRAAASDHPMSLWLKLDTGMNRLGFTAADLDSVIGGLPGEGLAHPPVLCSHFSCADDKGESEYTKMQWDLYQRARHRLQLSGSIANSAAALSCPQSCLDWARVGIALYGGLQPSVATPVKELRPVMTVRAPVIALRVFSAGARVGYGGDYRCPHQISAAVIGIGYGDGYPRALGAAKPVFLNGRVCRTIGRMSMDMMTVDLNGAAAQVGDQAELWGSHLHVSEVARACQTISYELLCSASSMETVDKIG